MNREQLEHVLHLQEIAYRLLLWLNQQAAREPARLDDDHFARIRSADDCAEWLREMTGQIPTELRVGAADASSLANLFSSFTRTSFERELVRRRWQGPLIPQLRPLAGRFKAQGRKARRKNSAEAVQLMRIALVDLAGEEAIVADPEAIDRILSDSAQHDDLTLWSYAWELVRRSQFASQGPAVHYMWRQLEAESRRRLSVDAVWQARSRLLNALGLSCAGPAGTR